MGASRDAPGSRPHTPVLYHQVLSAIDPRAGGLYIDGTLGTGGHAWGLLERSSPDGRLLGLDRDPAAIVCARRTLAPFGDRVYFRHGSFADMAQHAAAVGWEAVHGILLDLGISSMQLDDAQRGFSFRYEGPLDMRFDAEESESADDLVNQLSESELADILAKFGEEPRARRIAAAIVRLRPIHTTTELAQAVMQAVGRAGGRIHPATRTFQALRIAVNDELGALERGLQEALALLHPGGRLAVISFHSLEDRLVKQFMRREERACICPPGQPVCTCGHQPSLRLVERRPIKADEHEVRRNPRARSARLRVAERL
jgi:16S rRNA (cytosine1402-N4)-methyltransferase